MTRTCSAFLFAVWTIACAGAQAADWGATVEVRHEDELCVAYQARVDGPYLVVHATLGSGWHTFAMDNKVRAEEKLAGKPALSIDRATEIAAGPGLTTDGPWYETPPKDFSRAELRWFSWGFDRQALFVTKVKRNSSAASTVTLKGQACTDKICKNIDVSIPVPAAQTTASAQPIELRDLVQVR